MLSRMILILSNFVITWLVVIVALATAVLRVRSAMRRDKKKITMGFFHPYWCAIRPIIEQGQACWIVSLEALGFDLDIPFAFFSN